MKKCVSLFLVSSLVACAAVREPGRPVASGDEVLKISSIEEYSRYNERCVMRWGAIYDEWVGRGGWIAGDLNETRSYILKDGAVLSQIFREAWRLQRRGANDVDRVRSYDDAALRSGAIPAECASFTWLQEFIASDEQIFRDDAKSVLEKQMGVGQNDPSRLALRVMQTLLIPPAGAMRK